MNQPATSEIVLARTPFNEILGYMAELHAVKSNDYAGSDDPYSNFRLSASQVQAKPMLSVEVLIATKQARLRELMWTFGKTARNESIADTLLDRAVYAVIALLLWNEGSSELTA